MRFIIYTLSYCQYCVAAKDLLQSKGLPFEEIVSDSNKEDVKEKNSYSTFPQIFVDGELLGGYDNLTQYITKNNL
jgi:glutaredoxin 3